MPKKKPDIALDDPEIIAEAVQPDAAIKFWQERAKLTWDQAKGLADGAKARAFYVTGLYQQDLVQLVSDGIEAALANGETLPQFRERILAAIQAQGWHSHRVENIFRTNMQSAYAAGRYKKMQAVKNSRPYWQYMAVMDKRVRPSHAVLHGKVYPADHEFWDSNYPPNGFRCRCGVITLSERQVKAQGLTVENDMPQAGMWTDPKTGMEYFVNFPGADKGWRSNPGRDWMASLYQTATGKLENAHPRVAAATVRALVRGGFDYWSRNPSGNFPLCVLKKADAEAIGAKATVAVLSAETMKKQQSHHPELTAEDYAKAQDAVESGEKWPQNEKNLAFILNEPGGMVVIVKATLIGDELYVVSLYHVSHDDLEREKEVRRLKRGRKKKG